MLLSISTGGEELMTEFTVNCSFKVVMTDWLNVTNASV